MALSESLKPSESIWNMLYEENTVTLEQKTRFTTVSVINIQKQAAIPPQSADPDILS